MVDDLARRQIRAATSRAIARAGVAGIIPTPLDAISKVAGIIETIDISEVPPELVARRPGVLRRVLGAVFFRPQLIVVDRSQGPARGRFIEAHEIIHKLMPAHEAIVRLDDEGRIFGPIKKAIEHESDVGAAELLFQGDLFVRRALEFRVSIGAPIALASEFGASITASVRHYAEYHPDPVAVLFAGKYRWSNGRVPVWGAHESPAFRHRFGDAAALFQMGLPASEDDADGPGPIVGQAISDGDVASGTVELYDLRGESKAFVLEAFCNQRATLVMLIEKSATRAIGRRLDLRVG